MPLKILSNDCIACGGCLAIKLASNEIFPVFLCSIVFCFDQIDGSRIERILAQELIDSCLCIQRLWSIKVAQEPGVPSFLVTELLRDFLEIDSLVIE